MHRVLLPLVIIILYNLHTPSVWCYDNYFCMLKCITPAPCIHSVFTVSSFSLTVDVLLHLLKVCFCCRSRMKLRLFWNSSIMFTRYLASNMSWSCLRYSSVLFIFYILMAFLLDRNQNIRLTFGMKWWQSGSCKLQL